MANIPLQYPFPYKTTNNTGFTSSVEFNTVTVLGDVTIDQNLTVAGNITTTDLTVGDDLTVGGTIDAQTLRAFGIWDSPTATVTGAGAWIGFDGSGHTIFANRKSTAGQTNSFRWYAYDETNTFQDELMRLSNAGNLFVSGTRIEFPLIHFQQPPGTFPQYDFILPSSMGGAGQVLTSAGAGNPMYWTTPSGGGGGGGTVTNVTGTSPISVTSPTTTPNISLGTVPTTLGGTGLTTVGTNGQVLQSDGTVLQYVTLPTPVTSVSGTSPVNSSGGSTPTISLSTIPTTLGGTGLTTVGTNGQVLQSDGTVLQYVTLPTPVTSVSATSPLASSGGATPTISIASSTGTGAVVLQTTPTLTGNVNIGYSGGTSRLNIGDGSLDTARYGSVQITQDATTIINTTNNVAALAMVRSGSYTLGLGYLQSSNTFGFGPGVTANFQPNFLCIDPILTRVGIFNINPEYTFDVSSINAAFRNGYGAGLLIDWNNIAPGSGATDFWNYRGGGGGGFKFKNRDTSNNDVGWSSIECGSGWFNGQIDINSNGEVLRLRGTDHVFMRYALAGVNKAYVGFGNAGDPNFDISNAATGGHINLFPNANVGIGTTSPAAKLHVNGSLRVQGAAITQNGAQSEFSSGSYFDPDSGQVYNAKFGNTDPLSNGIAVKGNSRFTSSVRAANFTTNGTNTFTYSETDFTPTIGFLTGATSNFVEAAVGATIPSFSYNIQTGRISRIGSIMTVVVDISFNIQFSIAAAPGIYIAIRLPEECRPASVGATAGGSWPQSIDPSNMRGYVLLNGTDSGGNIAYISPVNVNERLLWSIYGTSPQSNQRLFVTMTYILR